MAEDLLRRHPLPDLPGGLAIQAPDHQRQHDSDQPIPLPAEKVRRADLNHDTALAASVAPNEDAVLAGRITECQRAEHLSLSKAVAMKPHVASNDPTDVTAWTSGRTNGTDGRY